MRGSKTKALRDPEKRPRPGRKHGGIKGASYIPDQGRGSSRFGRLRGGLVRQR
jgi:hypothetical protein